MSGPIDELFGNRNHHAFLIVGNSQKNFEAIRHLAHSKVSAGEVHTADIWSRQFGSLSIDEARELKENQNTMPNGPRRVVILSLETIQHEAQNSLLKLFEEPSATTTFFICVENYEIFLPTLLSRFYITSISGSDGSPAGSLADTPAVGIDTQKFLASSIVDRLAMLEPILKEKDRVKAEHFLNDLESTLYKVFEKKLLDQKTQAEQMAVFDELFSARRFLRSRSSSVKMILEHICGIIPALKV